MVIVKPKKAKPMPMAIIILLVMALNPFSISVWRVSIRTRSRSIAESLSAFDYFFSACRTFISAYIFPSSKSNRCFSSSNRRCRSSPSGISTVYHNKEGQCNNSSRFGDYGGERSEQPINARRDSVPVRSRQKPWRLYASAESRGSSARNHLRTTPHRRLHHPRKQSQCPWQSLSYSQ